MIDNSPTASAIHSFNAGNHKGAEIPPSPTAMSSGFITPPVPLHGLPERHSRSAAGHACLTVHARLSTG